MKTTLLIDDEIMTQLRREAARQRKSISELVEAALRLALEPKNSSTKKNKLPGLPTFKGGKVFVDVSDRDALFEAMEEERPRAKRRA